MTIQKPYTEIYMEKMESDPLLTSGHTVVASRRRPSSSRRNFLIGGFLMLMLFAAGAVLGHKPKKPQIAPMIRVADLPYDRRLQPGSPNRLIVMGDIHGMHDEMKKLLKKLDFNPKHDQLVLTGDFITKGPDSCAVLDDAIKYNAACVRGNHEDEILRLYADHYNLNDLKTYPPHASKHTHKWGEPVTATLEPTLGPSTIRSWAHHERPTAMAELEAEYEELHNITVNGDKKRDMKLVKDLKKHHIRYLENCPAIMKLGRISAAGEDCAVVHGGLEWQIKDLEEQSPEVVMRIRGVLPPDWKEPTEESEGKPWFELWNKAQEKRPKNKQWEVIYGHDASKGLQLHKFSRGLDSKCQRGEKLSAIVFHVSDKGKFHQKLHQIKC